MFAIHYVLTVLGDGFARLDIENGAVGAQGDRYRLGDIKAILYILERPFRPNLGHIHLRLYRTNARDLASKCP